MLNRLIVVILAMAIAACGGGTVVPSATPTPQPFPSPSGPQAMWTTMQSPLFPSEWPPTMSTTWVRYTFEYGRNPTKLMDGVYVTQPLSRTIVRRDGTEGESTTLSTALDDAGIQGVKPLDAASSTALGKEPQVQAQLLALQAMPDEATAAQVRGYYRVWVGLNGAFTGFIHPSHAAFLEWIESDQ
jgi:hypothetical protein